MERAVERGYLSATLHPWPCFLFLLPLLAVYEAGVIWLGGPSPDALRAEIIARKIPVTSAAEALTHPAVSALYRERIDQCLSGVAACEQICRFKLLARGFTVENDELTPTLKLRRKTIESHFSAEIESLYVD